MWQNILKNVAIEDLNITGNSTVVAGFKGNCYQTFDQYMMSGQRNGRVHIYPTSQER